jgi:hypothetical protein
MLVVPRPGIDVVGIVEVVVVVVVRKREVTMVVDIFAVFLVFTATMLVVVVGRWALFALRADKLLLFSACVSVGDFDLQLI